MILEAILGVADPSDEGNGVRFAPMGVSLSDEGVPENLSLRPFATSRTGALLLREGRGVLNFTDDVFLFALTALSDEIPMHAGPVLEGACDWWEIEVERAAEEDGAKGSGEKRRTVFCRISAKHSVRPFSPFNRGKNAVLEAAILATRTHLKDCDRERLSQKIRELHEIVLKTGGRREIEAFDLVRAKL